MLNDKQIYIIMAALITQIDSKEFLEYSAKRGGEDCLVTVKLPKGASALLSKFSEEVCEMCSKRDTCSADEKDRVGSEFLSVALHIGLGQIAHQMVSDIGIEDSP